MHLTPMPCALLARRLLPLCGQESRQKQMGASDRGRSVKTMKTIRCIIILVVVISTACAAFAELPSEYITKNPDGSIKTKGKYTRDSVGKVLRFDVADGQGKPLYSEIPFYAEDGRIIRADRLLPNGTLDKVFIYLSDTAVVLDSTGKVVDKQEFSQKEFLDASKKK